MLTTVVFPLSVIVVSASNASIHRSPSKYCEAATRSIEHNSKQATKTNAKDEQPHSFLVRGAQQQSARKKGFQSTTTNRQKGSERRGGHSRRGLKQQKTSDAIPRLSTADSCTSAPQHHAHQTSHKSANHKRSPCPRGYRLLPTPTRLAGSNRQRQAQEVPSLAHLHLDEAGVGVELWQRHLEPQDIGLDSVEREHDLPAVVHLRNIFALPRMLGLGVPGYRSAATPPKRRRAEWREMT